MIYYQTENGILHQGDVLEVLKTLPSESVHMIVTSPPYWNLRQYNTPLQIWGGDPGCEHDWSESNSAQGNGDGKSFRRDKMGYFKRGMESDFCIKCGAWRGEFGLEPHPELYVEHIVDIFRECKRVLRKEGIMFLNIGDSYSSTGKDRSEEQATAKSTLNSPPRNQISILKQQNKKVSGYKLKDMIGIPWRVAFALQADGWYLRQDIIWHKTNAMPESVTDRCTKAHEYIFLFSKSKRYFYDNEAIREPQTGNAHSRGKGITPKTVEAGGMIKANQIFHKSTSRYIVIPGGRNKRSVWTIPTQSFSEAHFAVFPPELPQTCILAGTSQKGCCPQCGRPWERILERESIINPSSYGGKWGEQEQKSSGRKISANTRARRELGDRDHNNSFMPPKTIGWRPGPKCKCNSQETQPCIVLDPFGGAGTTGLAAEKLGRKWILIELLPDYCAIAKKRIEPWTKQFKMKLV